MVTNENILKIFLTDESQLINCKTFGMAKWRASQKARRKQGNLKLESQADSKPYHFDDPSEYDIGGITLECITGGIQL